MLLAQLETLEKEMELRDKNREKLDKVLSQIEGISINGRKKETTREANHLYLIRYDSSFFNQVSRENFFSAMQGEGVFTYAGYKPLYREELFSKSSEEYSWLKEYDYQNIDMPNTERLADKESVWIKQNHLLGDDSDIQDIIDAFEKVTSCIKNQPELFI